MKLINYCFLLFVVTCLSACSAKDGQQIASKNGFAVLPVKSADEAVATFAGGCFWAMQESLLQLKGVHTVISGYAGGMTVNPTYDEVLSKQTGHAEAVQVYYDPAVITYQQLANAFFYAHDPTRLNRQGPDVGSDYRSVAFFRSAAELKTLTTLIHRLESQGVYGTILTELEPFKVFYPAESAHQDYYKNNRFDPYIRSVSRPKVMHVRDKFPDLIKPAYLK